MAIFKKDDAMVNRGSHKSEICDIEDQFSLGDSSQDPLSILLAEEEYKQTPEYLQDVLDVALPDYSGKD